MRRTSHFLLATGILAAPMPVAAQVTVDPNALNALGPAALPEPPPAVPGETHRTYHDRRRHLARAEHDHARATAVASNGETAPNTAAAGGAAPGGVVLEHPKNLGPSFTSLPPLPQAAPPLPAPPPVPATVAPKAKPAAPRVETAQAAPTPKPSPPPMPPQLALPAAVPPPPSAPSAPTRLAEATPAPPAAGPPTAAPAAPASAPNALPKGADLLTLPFLVQDSDLPAAESAILRNFAQRYGAATRYIVRAYASAPPGDDDPSTPRRISLARAQSVASALLDSGAQPDNVRLLALGNAGGLPANRVEVIAMPPSSGHTASQSSP